MVKICFLYTPVNCFYRGGVVVYVGDGEGGGRGGGVLFSCFLSVCPSVCYILVLARAI